MVISELQGDLIVVKVSGYLAEDERFIQEMALLSQLGINYFLIHGGQAQIDKFIASSTSLSDEEKVLAMLKDRSRRYAPLALHKRIPTISNLTTTALTRNIVKAGGDAKAFYGSLFVGQQQPGQFKHPETGEDIPPNNFDYIPLNNLITIQDEEKRVLEYLRGEPDSEDSRLGRGVVRGFVVIHRDESVPKQFVGTAANGDADNIGIAHVAYLSDKPVIPVYNNGNVDLVPPRRVHFIELSDIGGLRLKGESYRGLVNIVSDERDLERYEIGEGMEEKAENNLRLARKLQSQNTPYMIMITDIEGFLPTLFNNQAITAENYTGIGTIFNLNGLEGVKAFYRTPIN